MLETTNPSDVPLSQKTVLTRGNIPSWLETVWDVLQMARETCIPEGKEEHDEQWSEVTTAMAWISEELGIDEISNGEAPT